jgi:hypothetical protein
VAHRFQSLLVALLLVLILFCCKHAILLMTQLSENLQAIVAAAAGRTGPGEGRGPAATAITAITATVLACL